MVRLTSDSTMLIIEHPMLGQNADGLKNNKIQHSTTSHTLLNGMRLATQLRPLSLLNQVILYQLCASNGPIWWFARPEIFHFPNKVWSTTSVTSVSSSKLHSLPSSAMFHHSMLPLVPEWLHSHTLLSHHSPSSLQSSSMTSLERFGCGMVWREKKVVWNWKDGSSKIHITEYISINYF